MMRNKFKMGKIVAPLAASPLSSPAPPPPLSTEKKPMRGNQLNNSSASPKATADVTVSTRGRRRLSEQSGVCSVQ